MESRSKKDAPLDIQTGVWYISQVFVDLFDNLDRYHDGRGYFFTDLYALSVIPVPLEVPVNILEYIVSRR